MDNNQVIIIGIAGASGSGKSLLAQTLLQELGSDNVSIIPEDCYYKSLDHMPVNERLSVNYDHPDSLEHSLLAEHVKQLKQGLTVNIPQHDYVLCTRKTEYTVIAPKKIIILEGILLFAIKDLCDLIDIKIYVDCPLDICLIRKISRDAIERARSVNTIITLYLEKTRPMFFKFVEPSSEQANLTIKNHSANYNINLAPIKEQIALILEQKTKTLDPINP